MRAAHRLTAMTAWAGLLTVAVLAVTNPGQPTNVIAQSQNVEFVGSYDTPVEATGVTVSGGVCLCCRWV
mgnify:CR=1 FL=1